LQLKPPRSRHADHDVPSCTALILLQFATVSGGISNVNAKISPAAGLGLQPVMFKVFGDKTEQIIDREAEKVVVVALGEQGFGPKVRGAAASASLRCVGPGCLIAQPETHADCGDGTVLPGCLWGSNRPAPRCCA
jgi:hypothetical protein